MAAEIYSLQCASCHGDRAQGSAIAPSLTTKNREQLLSGFERMPLNCLGLENCKPAMADYILVNFSEGMVPPPRVNEIKSTAVRLLSIKELQLSYQALTGIDPTVSANTMMPPESVSYAFERVVNSQTFGPPHLDGLKAMADEVIDTIAQQKLLKQFSSSCSDSIMPSPVASTMTTYSGDEMAFFPDYLDEVSGLQINISSWEIAPYTLSSFTHQFPAPGDYEIAVTFDASNPITSMGIYLDVAPNENFPNEQAIKTFSNIRAGVNTLTAVIHISDTNSHPIHFSKMMFSSGNNIRWNQVKVTGPIDPNAGKNLAALDACAMAVIDYLAPRAFRKSQLSENQRNLLVSLYNKGVTDGGFWTGIRYLMQGIFANPHFLFMVEVGTEDSRIPGAYLLDHWEVASRLSYALCRMPPDDALRTAASQRQLHNPNVIEVHARRLLESECGRQTVENFFEHWLNLQKLPSLAKDPMVFPAYNADVALGMYSETIRYLNELFWNEDANLATLFTANYSWPHPQSAFLYGLNTNTQEKMPLPSGRAGVLTQPSVLSLTGTFAGADPVHRGVFVLRRILCESLPNPPPVEPPIPNLSDPKSNRELWAEHSNNPACSSCHKLIDPIGFTFEGFNGIGQAITSDRFGFSIDSSGGVPSVGFPSVGFPDGSIYGAADLGYAVAESIEAKQCFAKHWLRYTLGRLDLEVDETSVANVTQLLETHSMKDALIEFFKQSSFVYRFEELE